MAMTYAVISGLITKPGSNIGIRARVTATPMTTANVLKFPDDDRITWGPESAETGSGGVLSTLKVPTNHGITELYWRLEAEPLDKIAGLPEKWVIGTFQITADSRIDDLVQVDVTVVTGTVLVSVADMLAATQAARDAAAASETAAAGSETSAQGWATAAASSAADSDASADLAAASQAAAATSATTATTKAGEAATSQTAAATSETNAAASASTATTKAGEAATSATAAQGYAQQASGSVSLVAWAPATVYAIGDVRQAPDGSTVRRNAAGTSRASFDATEQATWTAVLATSGTMDSAALLASYAGKPTTDLGDWALLRRDTSDVTRGVAWTTTQAAVARGLGWKIATDPTYGADATGASDSTAAIQTALTAAAGGTLFIPRGATFTVDALTVSSNTRVTGGGTLKFKNDTAAFALLATTAATGVEVDHLTLDGNIANQTTWNASRHCLQIPGGGGVRVHHCTFQNIIGDGIYILASGGVIPSDLNIHDNSFVGANTNRNGISLIAGTDVRIHHNYFSKMARDDMPGAIDLEPNATTDTISNVVIDGNVFVGGGTPSLQKAVAVNNNVGAAVTGVTVANNRIRDKYKYAIAVFGDNVDKTKTVVTIANNGIRGSFTASGSAAIILSSACEAEVLGNKIDSTVEYGIKSVGSSFKMHGNRVKNAAIYGIELLGGAAEAGSITNNDIEDCGTNANAAYGGLHIKGSYIDILGNRVTSSATTKTQTGLYIESGVKNRIDGNSFAGLGVRALNCPVAPQVFGRNIYSGGFNSVSGTYPPAAETWVAGDIIFNPNPAPGSGVGWVCTTAGTPGTWKTFGAADLSAIATLDFPSVAAAGSQELTVTVTGAAVGDTVRLGAPSTIEAGLVWNGYVSATNTVKIRVTNVTAAAIDPASASWKVTVVK